jgi:transposase
VIDVATLSVIRRWALREQLSIREIARRSGLSRNTIKKYLASEVVEPRYAKRGNSSKLDPYADKLSQWLKAEQAKSRKQQRTLLQMHVDLVALGFQGSYGRVAAFARKWRQRQHEAEKTAGRGTFVPLVFAPGEAFQFDWSEDWAVIGGERVKLQVAHTKLSHSRAFHLRAYPLQTHEMLFDAHNHAFRVLGGVPRRGIYDNMKTAVDRVGAGKARDINQRFAAMASHYLFEPEFCNPASGWEKGQVEKNVRDARHRLWQQASRFATLDELNDWLEQRCQALWGEIAHASLPGTVAQAWTAERAYLMQPVRAFDGFVEHTKRVSPTCLLHFERNRYSVPASYANRPVSLRVYAAKLVVVAEGQVLCEHPRLFQRNHQGLGQTVYDWRHYLAVLQRKPGALRNGAPFAELPAAFRRLQTALLRQAGGDREMVEILALVLHHDEQAVLAAVELALEAGAPTKTHVLNVLHRLLDGKPQVVPVQAPQALKLSKEPLANVVRYDTLRAARKTPASDANAAVNAAAATTEVQKEVRHAR